MVVFEDSTYIYKTLFERTNFKYYNERYFQISFLFIFLDLHCAQFLLCQSLPLLYCFLFGQNRENIHKFDYTIKQKLLDGNVCFNLDVVQIDFERTTFNEILTVWPTAEIKGCYFYFRQDIWGKVQHLSLTILFHQDLNFKKLVQLTSTLAIIPILSIDTRWGYILTFQPMHDVSALELKS